MSGRVIRIVDDCLFESSVASVRAKTIRKEEKKGDLRETSPLNAEIGQPRNCALAHLLDYSSEARVFSY